MTIATIDHDRVILSSELFQQARAAIENQHKVYKQDLEKREGVLRDLEKTLRVSESTLSQGEFAKQRRQFEEKVEEAQKLVAERRRKLDTFMHTIRLQVVETAMSIIQILCQERDLSIVIPNSQIIYALSELDITEEVLERVNKQLSQPEKIIRDLLNKML